ncbi:MAG: hypothetical protein ACO3TX_06805 [Pseudomonadales bacterium]
MEFQDILSAKSTDDLSDMLAEFCRDCALPLRSADELLLDVLGVADAEQRDATRAQLRERIRWLSTFINQWEQVQSREDFDLLCAIRGEDA